jgi:hypothetical protein
LHLGTLQLSFRLTSKEYRVEASGVRKQRLASLAVLFVTLTATACQGGQTAGDAGPLPAEVHGMELVEVHSGADASGVLEQLHASGAAPEADNYVGHYGTEEMGAIVYLSRFATADEASEQRVAMAQGIGRGAGGFGHTIRFRAGSKWVQITFGQGRVHYFWDDDVDLVWITLNDAAVARPVLAEMLQTSTDSIPTFEELISGRPVEERGT